MKAYSCTHIEGLKTLTMHGGLEQDVNLNPTDQQDPMISFSYIKSDSLS